MQKLQLLSPVGSWDALVAAVSNGADAVYLGSKLFNARRLAGNFTNEELKRAVRYAHLHHVKVYQTLNTLIKNQEIPVFLKQAALAASLGVDALILQDLTFAPLIKKYVPLVEIHASTQATIMNSSAIEYWMKHVDTFVLARELSKQEVRRIFDTTKARLEVFVHGHLCISYSGQCLISSLIGKRSGNRGLCASSCRKQYNGEGYLLSAKDLCMINNISDVAESGAATVKIEGRMKPAEYVATTTKYYRQQIDQHYDGKQVRLDTEEINELKMAFNREFTPGYFHDEQKIVDPSYSSKRGVYLGTVRNGLLRLEEDLELQDGIGLLYHGKRKGDYVRQLFVQGNEVQKAAKGSLVKIPLPEFINDAKVYLMSRHQGKNIQVKKKIPIGLSFRVTEGRSVECTVAAAGKEFSFSFGLAIPAEKHPLSEEQLQQEWKQYQSDIFECTSGRCHSDRSFVPQSAFKKFRRELEGKLLEMLSARESSPCPIPSPLFPASGPGELSLHVHVYSLQGVQEAIEAGANVIYYDAFAPDVSKAVALCRGTSSKLYFFTPMKMTDEDISRLKEVLDSIIPEGMMVNNVGVLGLVLKLNLQLQVILGYQMNIFNDQQLSFYGCPAVVSLELNVREVAAFQQKDKIIFFAHGSPVVMTFKEDFSDDQLTDAKGYTFPLRKTTTGATEMLYSRKIGILQRTPEVIAAGIHQLFLDLEDDVFPLVSLYKKLLQGEQVSVKPWKGEVTLGNFVKGVM